MVKQKVKKRKERKGGRGRRREGSGLVSSAGLMRYYDTDESVVKISPKTLVFISVLIGVVILSAEIYFGVWPS
ncbi:MAG: preprotein translocase subunit Sec61beta [Candidatus Methanospirareceae archaeon]